ncbi:MAG: EF-hand domain-containing protein [Acidobacteriota bacterium]
MTPIESTNPLQQLARQLVQRFDTNGDGVLTTQEFTTFLTTFMGTLNTTTTPQFPGTPAPNEIPRGNGGRGVLEGFDTRKLGDPSVTTVKYRFGRVAQNWDLSSVVDMASAESLLNRMKAELQASGVTVLDVSKDKIKVLDDSGEPAWVDVIRGAGASGAAWQWLDTRFA